jgi:tetratricopeptide (TPR) repeat protein
MTTTDEIYAEGEKLKDEGKYEEAAKKFEEVLAQDGNYALAHFALAVVYGKLNRHEEAVKHGQRACELEPEDPFSFTAMSVTFQRAFAGTQNPQFIQLAEDAMARAQMLQQRPR